MDINKEPLFDNKCPKCASSKLSYGVITPQDEIMLQDVTCDECHFEFGIYATCVWYFSNQE